jgi:hypothetical protein
MVHLSIVTPFFIYSFVMNSTNMVVVRTYQVEEFCAILGCYEVSTGNPLPTFRDTPEERRSYQHPGGSLKSRLLGGSNTSASQCAF